MADGDLIVQACMRIGRTKSRFLDDFSGFPQKTERIGERDRPGRRGGRLATHLFAVPSHEFTFGWAAFHEKPSPDVFGGTPNTACETTALVRLRRSVHGRVEVPLWRCFPPRVEGN